MTRPEILDTAKKCVCGDREQDYGTPENNFKAIASMWNSYLYANGLIANNDPTIWKGITPVDVAAMLALLKIARIASGHGKADNWIDLAGYAACGGEIESAQGKPTTEKSSYVATPITQEVYEEMFAPAFDDSCLCGATFVALGEPVKGKYERLSNFELDELFCSPTPCNKCPVLVRARELDISCNGFIANHPEEFRKIAIAYLAEQDKAKEGKNE